MKKKKKVAFAEWYMDNFHPELKTPKADHTNAAAIPPGQKVKP